MDPNSNPEHNANPSPLPTDTQNDYYAALKRIEEEKEAKKKEKKKKRRLGCGIFLLVIFIISILNSIGNSIGNNTERESMAKEPITQLDIREVIVYAKQNGVDNANEKFRTHKNGYVYRYNCIAKVEMQLDENIFLVSIPYFDDNSEKISTAGVISARLEIPSNINIGYDGNLPEYWLILENVAINIYVSNEAGILATPVIDSLSSVSVELSQEAAINWLNSVTEYK